MVVQLEDELVKLEVLEQHDQPIVLELQAEVDELRQTVQTLNREQATLKARYRSLRDVNDAEIRQKVCSFAFHHTGLIWFNLDNDHPERQCPLKF